MEQVVLKGEVRQEKGKEFCKKRRVSGQIPAIVYGKGMESVPILVDQKEFTKNIMAQKAYNAIITLKVKINKKMEEFLVMLSEIQRDVFQKAVLHVDFKKISLKEKVEVTIPVRLEGEAAGVKDGGILDHILWEVDIKALPLEIPEYVSLNVSSLKIGDSLAAKDIVLPEKVTLVTNPEELAVIVHAPKAVVEEKPVVEGEVAPEEAEVAVGATTEATAEKPEKKEPEVIRKGKKEE